MSLSRFARSSALSFAALVAPSAARADVPPGPDYVESCTVANMRADGRECVACDTYFGNPPDHCAGLAGEGASRACRTAGASTWTEVWCKPSSGTSPTTVVPTTAPVPAVTSATTAATATAEDEDDGCHVAGGPGSMLLVAVSMLGLLARRSRRS